MKGKARRCKMKKRGGLFPEQAWRFGFFMSSPGGNENPRRFLSES